MNIKNYITISLLFFIYFFTACSVEDSFVNIPKDKKDIEVVIGDDDVATEIFDDLRASSFKYPVRHFTTTSKEGLERDFYVQEPNKFDPRFFNHPILLLYHGFSSDAENMIEKFSEYAYQNGYVLVAPNGMPDRRGRTAWNAGACCSVVTNRRYDDLAFSTTVLGATRKALKLNPLDTKLFVAGFSNGAMMAHHFACSEPDRVDGIAAISGPMNSKTCDNLKSIPHPIPVWSSHSTNDPILPIGGGFPIRSLLVSSRLLFPIPVLGIKKWAELNKCDKLNSPIGVKYQTLESAYISNATNCDNNVPVTFYRLNSGGHKIPGTEGGYGKQKVFEAINAPQAIINFFKPYYTLYK